LSLLCQVSLILTKLGMYDEGKGVSKVTQRFWLLV